MHTNYRLFVLTESDAVMVNLSAGQHGDQPPSFCLVTLVNRFLSLMYRYLPLAIRVLLLHDRDRSCGESDDGQ